MLLAAHPRGTVVVAQPAHGWMCGQLARAWGNDRFGAVEPAEEVCLAAEQHDSCWAEWELSPTLNKATGLPDTFETAAFGLLDERAAGSRRLATQSRYAGLLVSLHHSSFFESPGAVGLLRADGRRIQSFLRGSASFEAGLRATLRVPDEEIERNRRLVRAWDGLSHDLILDAAPARRSGIPLADGALGELAVERRNGVHTVDPWPFAADRVVLGIEGRLLEERFTTEERMREALTRAPWIALSYDLQPR
jgi:hypothetical protein